MIFATNNQHKVEEIQAVAGNQFGIITLKDAGIEKDIPEPYDTLEENASAKSRTIHQMTGMNCFSEDTGLFVDILNGEPGVKSARYAGEEKSFDRNIEKLLHHLGTSDMRTARFKTVISLILDGKEHWFEGVCEGRIGYERKGNHGFGYDAVFIPLGSTKTFAEMSLQEKNVFSHRKKATDKLVLFLQDAVTISDGNLKRN